MRMQLAKTVTKRSRLKVLRRTGWEETADAFISETSFHFLFSVLAFRLCFPVVPIKPQKYEEIQ
jgi:hypothetical protein